MVAHRPPTHPSRSGLHRSGLLDELGEIAKPGQRDRFPLTDVQRLVFVAADFSIRARWVLTSPGGQTVFPTTSASREVEVVEAGSYRLPLSATDTVTATYGFRITTTN